MAFSCSYQHKLAEELVVGGHLSLPLTNFDLNTGLSISSRRENLNSLKVHQDQEHSNTKLKIA